MVPLMDLTPIERIARWWAEPKVRSCKECGSQMPATARRDGDSFCSDDCAEEYQHWAIY